MKDYQKLLQIPVFTLNEANETLGKFNVSNLLNRFIKDGSIKRIKKNLYTCFNFANGDDVANKFQIASKITNDSFVSYHSAFEFYGFYNQVSYEVQVSSSIRFLPFEYDDNTYKCFLTNNLNQVVSLRGVRVTTIERTIVDSINMLGKVMDAEELVKCLDLVMLVDEDKILDVLNSYNKEILYRKVGYVLSFYKDEYELSDNFFKVCKEKGIPSNKGSLLNEKGLKFISKWGIYAYEDLRSLASKGGELDV